jgi:hypothetical protein
MTALLTSKWRLRMGAILIALYTFCLVAPVAAFASGNGMSADCLGEAPHVMAMADHMAMAAGHHHDGMSHQPAKSGHEHHGLLCKCCTMFCASAVAPAMDAFSVQPVRFTHLASLPSESLTGLGTGRIDRPPRSLLSL